MRLTALLKFSRASQETKKLLHTTTLALTLAGAYTLFTHILVPATHSVHPLVLYRTGDVAAKQNQYVTFLRTDEYLPGGKAHLVKRLGCIGGQFLSKTSNQFYCDGTEIALAMLRDSNGKSLPQFSYTGVIPTDMAFAVGDTTDSYDSRYWGLLKISDTERLVPIF
ncbi:S26 family signal peptidase [Rahnella inusitata]|jgi:conjugal transfer pilin signal peptidase TrbI|uniref:S26 family signal peptidase n=1 Tax=Rahnella inusitata TaxID=58169 RepID=UPI0039BE6DE6